MTSRATLARALIVAAALVAQPIAAPAEDAPVATTMGVASRAPDLLARYIRVDTTNPPGNEIEGAKFLAELLAAEGVDARIFESQPGRANLYARLPGTGEQKALILLSHIDVVPAEDSEWTRDAYAGLFADGAVYGRGALDCKGVGIVQLLAFIALKRGREQLSRDVIYLATADEEMGGALGAGWFVREHGDLIADAEFVLNEGGFVQRDPGLPLIYNLNAAEKAPCWFRVEARGEPGHASRPPDATAVTRLIDALERLVTWSLPLEVGPVVAGYYAGYAKLDPHNAKRFRQLERSLRDDDEFRHSFMRDPGAAALVRDTLTPTVLRASTKTNVVPATAWADIDSRLLPGHDCSKFLDSVRTRIGPGDHVRVERSGVPFAATESPLDNELTAAMERTAAQEEEQSVVLPGLLPGFTDSHWFRERGIAAYGFAPIDVTSEQRRAIHGSDENVDAGALERGVTRMVTLIRELSR